MPRTPLVAPEDYFARDGALALPRALLVVVAFWLVNATVEIAWGRVSEFELPGVTAELFVSAFGMPLRYWLFAAAIVYVLGYLRSGEDRLYAGLALGAWGLAPAVVAWAVANVARFGIVAAEPDPSLVPYGWDILIPLAGFLLACVWAAAIWGPGLERAYDLDRETARSTARFAAAVCAALLVLEASTAFV